MDTKILRNKILDLAIHGKLVPQDPNDEPASALLARIRAEKEQLVKDGKLKKKDLVTTPVSDEDKPFEVPEGWEWTTLGGIFNLQAGKNISASEIYDFSESTPFPCYGGNGIRGYVKEYNKEGQFPIIGRQGALCGNINFAEGKFYATEHAVVVTCFAKVSVHWARYILDIMNLNQYATATAQPGLSVATINDVLIPLPSLPEQQRIVAAVEQWMSLVDVIESGQENLQQSIALAKNKILDLAIKGKLVEKQGEWEEVKLKEILSLKSGEGLKVRDLGDNGIYPVYGGNGINGYYSENNVDAGTLIIGRVGFYCGSIHKTLSKAWVTDNALMVSIIRSDIDVDFLRILLIVLDLKKTSNSTAQPVVSGRGIYPLSIPLPPLSEQQRIVAKIEELFAQLDIIAKALK